MTARSSRAVAREYCTVVKHARGCRRSRPLCRRMRATDSRRKPCFCSAYHFPHRNESGACKLGIPAVLLRRYLETPHVTAPTLYPFQRAALREASDAFQSGAKAVLLVSPTGSGKTVMLARAAYARYQIAGRVVWLVHRRELIEQAANALRALGIEVGCFGLNSSARVQVCSPQSILSRGITPPADLVIPDEAHHFADGNDCTRILETYRAAGVRIFGATATPERGDGRGLSPLFDKLVVSAQIRELVELGRLLPCDVLHPPRRLKSDEVWLAPADAYAKHAPGSRAVVFAPNEVAAKAYAEQFAAIGVKAAVVMGNTPAPAREARIAAFRDGSISVLVNVFVLTEGFDCPALDTVIVARGCSSQSMWLQMIGRALRAHCPNHAAGMIPGGAACDCPVRKERARVLDLRGVVYDLGAPDADREYSLEGRGISCAGIDTPRLCKQCGSPLPDDGPCLICERDNGASVIPHAVGNRPLEKYTAPVDANARVRALAGILRGKGTPRTTAAARQIYNAMFKRYPANVDIEAAQRLIAGGQ